MVDNMIKLLEKHSEYLEELVEERTKDLELAQNRVESLLHRMVR
jgi:hypothetical protein